jgi:hypothetical protein
LKSGDIVRFIHPFAFDVGWTTGFLLEYHTWEKIATILYNGEVLRIAARDVQLVQQAGPR